MTDINSENEYNTPDNENSTMKNENKASSAEGTDSGYRQNNYPYGQNESPYGQNNSPYSKPPYYPPPVKKPSLLKRITAHFTQEKYIELSIAATATGLALIFNRILDYAFGTVLRLVPALSEMYFSNYLFSDAVGMIYTLLCVGFPFFAAYIFLKKVSKIEISFDAPRKKSGFPFMFFAGMGIFYIGNLITNYLVSILASMGIELYSYNNALSMGTDLPKNAFEFILMAFSTAVVPALIEEFAFRGVMMQPLRRYGDWFAITVSAVLFGLIHGNMMQMPFAIVAGMVLGYVYVVTGSIWTSVILHFCNNFLSLLYSFAGKILPEGRTMIFSSVFTYGIILIGIAALAGYAFYNPRFMRLYPSKVKGTEAKKCAATYFLMPAMTVPLILILQTVFTDIKF